MSSLQKDWEKESRYLHIIAKSSAIDCSFGHEPIYIRKQQVPACILDNKVTDWVTNLVEYWDFDKQEWLIDNGLMAELDNSETDLELLDEKEFYERLENTQSLQNNAPQNFPPISPVPEA